MLTDVFEIVGGLPVMAVGGAVASVFFARRYALRLAAQGEREDRLKKKE